MSRCCIATASTAGSRSMKRGRRWAISTSLRTSSSPSSSCTTSRMASGERSRDCASPPNAALCPRPGLRHGRLAQQEAFLRRGNARAEREGVTAFSKRQLHTAERGKDLELAERAEVADAEHAAAQLAQAHPEREVEAIARGVGLSKLRGRVF